LIIRLEDNTESYEIGITGDSKTLYYLTLKYPEISKKFKKDKINVDPTKELRNKKELKAILSTGVEMDPISITYNLQNRAELKNLPDNIDQCNCATVNNFKLGIEFKVYIEKPNGWTTFDAKNLLVQE